MLDLPIHSRPATTASRTFGSHGTASAFSIVPSIRGLAEALVFDDSGFDSLMRLSTLKTWPKLRTIGVGNLNVQVTTLVIRS